MIERRQLEIFELYRLISLVSFDGERIKKDTPINEVYVEKEFRGLVAHCESFSIGVNPYGDICVCTDTDTIPPVRKNEG